MKRLELVQTAVGAMKATHIRIMQLVTMMEMGVEAEVEAEVANKEIRNYYC